MQRLSSLTGLLFIMGFVYGQSPHGPKLKLDCAQCHTATGWTVDRKTMVFNHDSTQFKLEGRHVSFDCKQCHLNLVFEELKSECRSCHQDPHQNTVGDQCQRCHNTETWIVNDIQPIHTANGFPLLGQHLAADCRACHTSETELRFDRIGNDCINCHRQDYEQTSNPDHQKAGYGNDCAACHDPASNKWNAQFIQHDFFPLTGVHNLNECKACHTDPDYSKTSPECLSCHQDDYDNSTNPKHNTAGFGTNCLDCHTLVPDWRPVNYTQHDQNHFPIYSGEHKGEWKDCASCHLNNSNYKEFSCTVCHTNPDTDEEHDKVNGYFYNDQACFACHPKGDKLTVFDHNSTAFPLTGAHKDVNCVECHSKGFNGTSTICVDCHTVEFSASLNPDHTKLNIPNDCKLCHTTEPDWKPATFPIHDQYYVLKGAHQLISNDCASCHKGDYTNTPNTCSACHIEDYNSTTDPPHLQQRLSTECINCHTESAWVPSTFDHDGMHFPIYSGKHRDQWMACSDCHTNPSNYLEFKCTGCHLSNETDQQHRTVQGYWYQDYACLACHPNGSKDDHFDHNMTAFPLTGAHLQVDCKNCHLTGFKGTSHLCADCHTQHFDQSINPNHTQLGLSKDCAACHTTNPDWKPARFDIHNQYYELKGGHSAVAMDCDACHKGDYINTSTECRICHVEDYNQTVAPPHAQQRIPMECSMCHTEQAWSPSSFEHDMYFPIYRGKHQGEWVSCQDCHLNPSNYREFKCTGCHLSNETDPQHQNVQGYWYNDQACFVCHPTGDKLDRFDHNSTVFPLTGAHLTTDCKLCHSLGFKGTPTECAACHLQDFENSTDPNHNNLGLSMDCIECHTTAPDWQPARFDQHDQIYQINGAHKLLDCASCHKGNYINTPNTCSGCHIEDYNNTLDPAHLALKFSTECASCHTENQWVPSTFEHDGQHFPIYSGKHKGQWMECRDCHINPTDIKVISCVVCHLKQETDDEHQMVTGYFYQDQACFACHPTGDGEDKFDHNTTTFPLTGAHAQTLCISCHQSGFKGTPTECSACHQNDFNASLNPNHINLGLPMDCGSCHTTHPDWKPAKFEQHDQYYVLNGAHKQIASDCAACHQGNYNNTPNTCSACHTEDYNNTKNPDHKALLFSTDCASCHTENAWVPSTFDHDGMHFPIYSGKHKNEWMECKDCHANPSNYKEFVCISCHMNPETDEKHMGVSGYFYNNQACFACHPTGSKDDMFDHNSTAFPLTGAHLTVECKACHLNGFKGTPMECEKCHLGDFNGTTNPNHGSLGFNMDCAKCHTTTPGWKPALMPEHDAYYPLTGRHLEIANDCAACHKGNYNNTPNTCEACHLNDYNNSKNPNHNTLGLSYDCAVCHTTKPGWEPATFPEHDSYYPLTGRHLEISGDCAACHKGNYNNTPNTCDGCHLKDYQQSKNPNHNTLALPLDCAMCHTTKPGWEPAFFPIHDSYYPLTGAHQGIANDCAVCHHGDYNNTPNTCEGCHLKDYNGATNPSHKNLNLSKDCADCHTTNPGWAPALFPDHNSYYPLNGAHQLIAMECNLCHNGNYNNTPNTCVGCHLTEYNQTSNPDHEAQQFPKDCASCHTETAWIPSNFDHNNYYVLTGGHAIIQDECILCHNGNYGNTPNTCKGCHLSDFNQTTNPNHVSLGFPQECQNCHTTNPGWEPALMPNHDSYYPLLGAHLTIKNECNLCHNGNYNNTPNTCSGCHIDDYNNTNNPDHQVAQFPTNCELCHTVNAWVPSNFNHDGMYFPIYTGKHKDEWNTCSDCHTNPNNYNIFSCINCHEHNNKNEVDDDHNGVSGYSYNSAACYSCHPMGKK
ncbi:MAG: hypothetical protein IPM34_00120 [Saprospiraceae bacterium]|nr:hypothetical protein [Saprospiraceae bacterium]